MHDFAAIRIGAGFPDEGSRVQGSLVNRSSFITRAEVVVSALKVWSTIHNGEIALQYSSARKPVNTEVEPNLPQR